MSSEYQVISITGPAEHNRALKSAFDECGFRCSYITDKNAYNLDINDITTIIVAILGAGGINAIINSIIQRHKKTIKVKMDKDKGIISDLEIESCMSADELKDFIHEIKEEFKLNSAEQNQ